MKKTSSAYFARAYFARVSGSALALIFWLQPSSFLLALENPIAANLVGNGGGVVSCRVSDGTATVFLQRSAVDDPNRTIWIERNGQKETIWTSTRKTGFSIATNRGVDYRQDSKRFFRDEEQGLNDWMPPEARAKQKSKFIKGDAHDPDPYQYMEIVSAAINERVLVVVMRTTSIYERQSSYDPCYYGGFFFDQLGASGFWIGAQVAKDLPPHSHYPWHGSGSIYQGFPENNYNAPLPLLKLHGGHEYFLRSFVKNDAGHWSVHVSAVLSILWADSLSLPFTGIAIKDDNTYVGTFEGRHVYREIDALDEIRAVASTVAPAGVDNLPVFDHYGTPEKLRYRSGVQAGITKEVVKYIPRQAPEHQERFLLFSSVYTSFQGSDKLVRVAYDKDYFRGINSWVTLDELSDDEARQRYRASFDELRPAIAQAPIKFEYGCLPIGFAKLNPDEVRQTYTLTLDEAKQQVEKTLGEMRTTSVHPKLEAKHVAFRNAQEARFEVYRKALTKVTVPVTPQSK